MKAGPIIQAVASVISLGITGCSSSAGGPSGRLPVSVSAANYSQLPEAELYASVNGPPSNHPEPPAVSHPDRPIFYAFVRGETFPSDTPMETVYRELATPLAQRGYFNIVYEYQAGYRPNRIDYLLRIHSGVRRWKTPVVRTDKVTWGNYGLMSDRHNPFSAYLVGDPANTDSRAGPDANMAINAAIYLQNHVAVGTAAQDQYAFDNLADVGGTLDYCLVVVEAFRFVDVARMKSQAPCVWSTFIAVPRPTGLEFSSVLRAMVRTATPYFGTTTDGLQVFDVPPGKVLMGTPVEVTGPQRAPGASGQSTP